MPVPTPRLTVKETRALRQRSIRNGAALIAKSLAELANAPIIQDSSRTLRGLVADLKAPKANDKAIQEVLAHIEVVTKHIEHLRDIMADSDVADIDSPAAAYMCGLQELSDFLRISNSRFESLQNYPYTAKFMNQHETAEELSKHKQELADYLSLLDLKIAKEGGT